MTCMHIDMYRYLVIPHSFVVVKQRRPKLLEEKVVQIAVNYLVIGELQSKCFEGHVC